MNVFNKFEEVENQIAESIPGIIYKYRNWEDKLHKKIITDTELWFAHPHTLNDPYDVRPPYNFIVGDLDLNLIKIKIKEAGRAIEPDLTEGQLEMEVEKRIQSIIQDPISYFRKNRMDFVLNSSKYDNFGVLSFCASYDNEPMWAHYGNNHNGFAIGFNTVKLAKSLNCTFGFVEYDDKPLDYYILGDNSGVIFSELFRKSTKWKSEEEIRFATIAINIYRHRLSKFPIDAVEEVIFGLNTKKEVQDEIIEMVSHSFPGIPFFKLKLKSEGFGFEKVQL